jgi:hypothetical protein
VGKLFHNLHDVISYVVSEDIGYIQGPYLCLVLAGVSFKILASPRQVVKEIAMRYESSVFGKDKGKRARANTSQSRPRCQNTNDVSSNVTVQSKQALSLIGILRMHGLSYETDTSLSVH